MAKGRVCLRRHDSYSMTASGVQRSASRLPGRPLARAMQIRIGERITLTPGNSAAECASMFLVGVTADRATAQSHG